MGCFGGQVGARSKVFAGIDNLIIITYLCHKQLVNMRTLYCVFLSFLVFVACTHEGLVQNNIEQDLLGTKAVVSSNPPGGHSVTLADVSRLASLYSKGLEYQLEPLIQDSDTLMYLCNFENGWILVSGDKRAIPIIAGDESGSFDLSNIPEGIKQWLGAISEEMLYFKKDTTFYDIENESFWEAIKKTSPKEKGQPKTRDVPEMKWYAIEYTYDAGETQTTIVPHLILTKWGQGLPWNSKCPWDSSASKRCYLGCVATAIGQLLYYSHFNLSKPNGLYHQITCSVDTISSPTTNIGFSRSMYYGNSTRWSDMATHRIFSGTSYSGDLMLDVGNRIGMEYSGSGSSASLINSVDELQTYYGIYSSNGLYQSSPVISNLYDGLPVLVRADNSRKWSFIPWGYTYSGGHSWLIDGIVGISHAYDHYKYFEYSENWIHYSEVYDSFEEITQIYGITDVNDYVYTQSQTSTVMYYLMNWGYNGEYDTGHFSMSVNDNWTNDNGNHIYNRKIVYDIH